MTSAAPRGSAERRKETGSRPPFGAALDSSLLIAGCAVFVVARSIVSAGRVHIDDLEYWLVGTVPMALLYGLAALTEHFVPPSRRTAVARRLIGAWIIALVLFCISRDFHFYGALRNSLEAFGYIDRGMAEFGVALLFTLLGMSLTLPAFVLGARSRSAACLAALAATVLATAMMYALLLWR